jgi:NitT/TauT family transport system permease protein
MRRLINRRPSRQGAVLLGALPFALVLVAYVVISGLRLAENPADKLTPAFSTMAEAIKRVATEPEARSGTIVLWADTGASLIRLGLGIGIATLIGLVVGVLNGLIAYARVTLAPFVGFLSMVPPMAILPILFIILGLEETSKVALIVIGIAPYLMRDIALRVEELPAEQLIKAQTLGASTWVIVSRVVLPQVLPRLIDGVRLSLGPAWLFLIAAEAIASTEGLGYRIFLMRRYLAMDVILPYVAWITLLAALSDWLLRILSRRAFGWAHLGRGA